MQSKHFDFKVALISCTRMRNYLGSSNDSIANPPPHKIMKKTEPQSAKTHRVMERRHSVPPSNTQKASTRELMFGCFDSSGFAFKS